MEATLKARLKWVDLYKETGDAGYVCRRCGISRPTLRKWLKRHQENGVNGLVDRSRKPRFFPTQKVNQQITEWILELRNERNPGSRCIQSELFRQYECSLSLAIIHKVLCLHQAKPLIKLKRKKRFNRYQRPIPGDRVQIDTCKIAPGSLSIYGFR